MIKPAPNRHSVFEYKDYKKFVLDWINRATHQGRGQRKALAQAVGCQTPYITHVLSGDHHFSPEQADACARWMGLNESEVEFFILLVLRDRAGTRSLEVLLSRQLSERRERATVLKKRLNIQETLSLEVQSIYYSSWLYSAVHMAVMLPHLRQLEALQKYFQLPLTRLVPVVDFLKENGLVEEVRGQIRVLTPILHLEKDSPLLSQLHTQWRMKSIEAFQLRKFGDLHYSGVVTLSRDDFEWVREKMSQFLEDVIARVKDSKEERLAALVFDWFEV